MRYREFELTEDELFELNMSPTNLAKMAKNIDARVGMEFELIVPNVENPDDEDEYESEPDMDANESFPMGPGWTRDVIDFFRGGEMGSSTRTIQRAIDELNESFYEWVGEQEEEYIASAEGQEQAIAIATNNVDRDDHESDEEYEAAVREFLDTNEDRIRDELIDIFRDDLDSKFEEWLDDQGINTMYDFADQYDLEWPYWTEPERYGSGGGASIDAVADDFSQAIGRPVNAASSYHGATRQPGHYVVEPDGSLQGDNGETGLEFVSPVLTVDEMLSDIDKVVKWAEGVGAYTNSSTGLHMNVSVPDQKNLDYVKLAMFLGDNYILEQFGREGNRYCKSALKNIVVMARNDPSRVEEMMRQFQGGLSDIASKVLHTGSTEKFVSINNRDQWVEFRGPGGDWLQGSSDIRMVKNTLLRAVAALSVATKPEEFKQEYYKKLYKTLTQGKEDDTIQYFARYAAGELPQSALKAFVRQIQGKRKVDKLTHGAKDILLVWKVFGAENSPYQSQGVEVVATDELGAFKEAINKWSLNLGGNSIEDWTSHYRWRAQPVRAATTDDMNAMSDKFYRVYPEGSSQGVWVKAMSMYQALTMAVRRFPDIFANVTASDIIAAHDPNYSGPETPFNLYGRSGEPVPAGGVGNSHPEGRGRPHDPNGRYAIVSREDPAAYQTGRGTEPEFLFRFNMAEPAEQHNGRYILAAWAARNSVDPANYMVVDAERWNTPADVPGSTNDLARQRLAAQMPRLEIEDGNWEIYSIASNNSVYRFAANTEEEAVRAFNIWQDSVRNPTLSREGFNLRAVQPGQPTQTTYNPQQPPARGTESLPPGNVRWLILDRNDNEIYSFINTTAQSDANQYARDWMMNRAPREVRDNGPFTIVPAR